METVDSGMTVMNDVETAVRMDSEATSADRTNTAGTEKIVNTCPDCVDSSNRAEAVIDESAFRKCTQPTADGVDNMRDAFESADTDTTEDSGENADLTDSRSTEKDDLGDSVDQSAKEESESDSDSTNEGTCLQAMTPYGQDHYLRLGDTPRRRSALRLSRIIARQQLLRRLSQGRKLRVMEN